MDIKAIRKILLSHVEPHTNFSANYVENFVKNLVALGLKFA